MAIRNLLFGVLPVLTLAIDTPNSSVERAHARELKKRDVVDCGTWTLFCAGTPRSDGGRNRRIENACNNACYYVRYLNGGDYTATFRTSTDNDRNRRQSGCNIGSSGHSVCTYMPFSQQVGGDSLSQPSCDEFPLADWAQDDWSEGTVRNALRCMESPENSAAGVQWLNFRDGVGDGLEGRTCEGPMNDDDTDYTFNIAFNIDEAASAEVGFCDPDQDELGTLDFQEFFMTQFNAPNGANSFPFNPESDNHYNIASGESSNDVLQCHLDLTRTSGDTYDVTFFNEENTELGSASGPLTSNGQRLLVTPNSAAYAFLAVVRMGEFGEAGTPGSPVRFEYRLNEDPDSSAPLVDFGWTSESIGYDTRFQEDGAYCSVPNIEDADNGPTQDIQCYFPCEKFE